MASLAPQLTVLEQGYAYAMLPAGKEGCTWTRQQLPAQTPAAAQPITPTRRGRCCAPAAPQVTLQEARSLGESAQHELAGARLSLRLLHAEKAELQEGLQAGAPAGHSGADCYGIATAHGMRRHTIEYGDSAVQQAL